MNKISGVCLATNLGGLLEYATQKLDGSDAFYGHGTDNSWDEAVALALYVFNLPIDADDSLLKMPIGEDLKNKYLELLDIRISKNIPIPYLTNEAWFCGFKFFIDKRVIIPRSPIAELIQMQFSPYIDYSNINRVLDLCTGSGCIAIACAKYLPNAIVDGIDISKDAIDVANKNKQLLDVKNVNFIESDLFTNLKNKKYDVIVSNPPYVDKNDFDSMPKEFTHEPKIALVSGDDGLDLTRQILKNASNYLNEGGILIVEVGNSMYALEKEYPNVPFLWLEFEMGGDGVFLLTKDQLEEHLEEFF